MTELTVQQVVSVAAETGRPLAVSTFRTYVAKNQAPQPVRRAGRTPLWDEDQIRTWIDQGRLATLTHDRALEQWHADSATNPFPVAPLIELDPSHLVNLNAALPLHESIAQAEVDLEMRIVVLDEAVRHFEASLARTEAEGTAGQDLTWQAHRMTVATLLQRWKTIRLDRAIEQDRTLLQQRLFSVRRALDDARHDLRTCRGWTSELLRWADAQRARRIERLLSEEMEAERRDRALQGDEGRLYGSAADFVLEDARRCSYALSAGAANRPIRAADVLEDLRATGSTKATLVLAGGDFGYSWRHDGSDNPGYSRPGQWRVSWIGSSGELYAEHRQHDKVWLVGTTPAVAFERAVNWLAPLERRQDERNSLAVLFGAYAEQREAGFPALLRSGVDGF